MSTAELITIPMDDERALEFAANTIKVADQELKKSFIKYILAVGPALLDARERLSTGGRGSIFGQWCDESLGRSRRHCNRLIDAFELIKKLGHRCPSLPPDQKTTLELAKAENPVEVWGKVISKTETPVWVDVKKEVGAESLSQKERIDPFS